jgi:hypothetical protein
MREQFEEAAMIAAMQALISNNPGISAKFAARKAQEYAIELGLVKYGEIIFAEDEDDIDPFTEQVV